MISTIEELNQLIAENHVRVDAEKREADHPIALAMNEAFDVEHAASFADPDFDEVAGAHQAPSAYVPISLIAPTDAEIIDMGAELGFDLFQWIDRLRLFVDAHATVDA